MAPIGSNFDLPHLASLGSGPVFAFSPSRKLKHTLMKLGYTHFCSLLAIPPRWLLPADGRPGMIAGTQIYEPYKWKPQVIKKLLIGMMRTGWDGWPCFKVLVASKDRFPLAALVHNVTGEAQPLFAFSLGRQLAVCKLAIQVMRPGGEILGYMKLPLTNVASERVRNEANMLERLWQYPVLRQHVPRVLYAGGLNENWVLFQSALPGERGPLLFNGAHERFLQILRDVYSLEMPGQVVIGSVAAKWEKTVRHMGTEWEELGQEVLRSATRDLQGKVIQCGVMHGDFAPWNTRLQQGELLLYDWESGGWGAPTSWDMFHFEVQTAFFFRKRMEFQACKDGASNQISFMLFVLNSVCQFLEEQNYSAIDHYKGLLIGTLQRRQALLESSASAA